MSAGAEPLTSGDWKEYPFSDPFARHVGPLYELKLDTPEEPVRIGFRIAAEHCNPMGFCHGGMLATLLDLGLGVVALRASGAGDHSPTIQMAMDFLRAVALGEWIETRCRLVHSTPRLLFADGALVTANGPVVRGNGLYRKGGKSRRPDPIA